MKKSKYKSQFDEVYIFDLEKWQDDRGWLIELFRKDQSPPTFWPAMAYMSMTNPHTVRGPHCHKSQTDYFAFFGPGDFKVHLWNKTWENHEVYIAGESCPLVFVIPPGIIHAYKNITYVSGLVFNAPNDLYAGPGKLYPVDEVRYEESDEFANWLINNTLD